MPRVDVADFLWDDDNEEKVALHGLLPSQVDELLDDLYVVDYNRRTGRADYLLIGRDYNGECIAVPIEEIWEPTRWRPVTDCRCKPAEWARLRQVRRRR